MTRKLKTKNKKKTFRIKSKRTNQSKNKSSKKSKSLKHCSPHINSKSKDRLSCFDNDVLIKLIKAWNKSNPKSKRILIKPMNKLETMSNKQLWELLTQKMNEKCNDEICLMKNKKINRKLDKITKKKIRHSIKPLKPKSWDKNSREWLNTVDIASVMRQYELKYPSYVFVGPVPIDFDLKNKFNTCMVSNLCKIDLKKLKSRNINKLGVIFNLDRHDQPGSHWIAMYMSLNDNVIGYWDSYGYKPPSEVITLMNKLKEQSLEMGYQPEIKINKKRHQYKGSECGVYSMHFIIEQLAGRTFEDVTETIVSDDDMWKNRQKYFNY